jgi:tRNA G18 (ribose-2'-O)-methylase SpoU
VQPTAVDSLDDPRLSAYRDLQDATLRERHGLFVAEGQHMVRRLVAGGRFRPHSVLLTPAALDALAGVLAPAGVPVFVAEPAVVRGVVGFDFHHGCVGLGYRGEPVPLDAVLAASPSVLVVLETIANPDNVGGIFRNARALGADAVLLAPGCADPLYRKAVRVSIGAALEVPFAALADWPRDLARLHAAGFTIVALTPDPDAVDLATLASRPARVALLLGSERDGLTPAARAAADVRVRIAMMPDGDSLNVATAAAIALHRLGRSGSP